VAFPRFPDPVLRVLSKQLDIGSVVAMFLQDALAVCVAANILLGHDKVGMLLGQCEPSHSLLVDVVFACHIMQVP
jgi:hypothetical protein